MSFNESAFKLNSRYIIQYIIENLSSWRRAFLQTFSNSVIIKCAFCDRRMHIVYRRCYEPRVFEIERRSD